METILLDITLVNMRLRTLFNIIMLILAFIISSFVSPLSASENSNSFLEEISGDIKFEGGFVEDLAFPPNFTPLIKLNANNLPLGVMGDWANECSIAGNFAKGSTDPIVELISDKKAVTLTVMM